MKATDVLMGTAGVLQGMSVKLMGQPKLKDEAERIERASKNLLTIKRFLIILSIEASTRGDKKMLGELDKLDAAMED